MQLSDLVNITPAGYFYADYPAFLSWLQDEYRAIYGADVYLEADSQDGQRLAILAKAFYDAAAKGAATYNSFSPVTAQGVGLSRNVKLNGISRRAPTHSTADVAIVGVSGTTITNGVAIDTLNQKWDVPSPTTIPGGGTITVTVTAQEEGALNAQANTINRIFTPTLGWQTVNNAAEATPGVAVETDAALRIRQTQSVADPSLTVLDGTIGGVSNLTGVTKVRGYENDTSSTDGDGLLAHSIALIVLGGDSIEIAQEILLHKTQGCYTNGTTSELVYDAHGMPSTIRFYRPTNVTITATVTISIGVGYSSDFADLIKQAVADYVNSIGIGNDALITKFFVPAYLNGSINGQTYDIVTIEIGKNASPQSDVNIDIEFNELPICDSAVDVTVTVV